MLYTIDGNRYYRLGFQCLRFHWGVPDAVMHIDKTLSDLSYMNTKFLKDYLSEVFWATLEKLTVAADSRFAAYTAIIRGINHKKVDVLENNNSDALYVAEGICGDKFWSLFKDQIAAGIEIDVEDGDLEVKDGDLLRRLLA